MSKPSHLFSCAACGHLTFAQYVSAFDHILSDPCHAQDLEKIRRQFGLDGERECINRMISVLLVADDATAVTIKDTARGRSNAQLDRNYRMPAASILPTLRTRVNLLAPNKYAGELTGASYYFKFAMDLQPLPSRTALLAMVSARFNEDWAEQNPGGMPPAEIDWAAAANVCCVMTTKSADRGPVRVKIENDSDVQRLAEIGGEPDAKKWMWTFVIGG